MDGFQILDLSEMPLCEGGPLPSPVQNHPQSVVIATAPRGRFPKVTSPIRSWRTASKAIMSPNSPTNILWLTPQQAAAHLVPRKTSKEIGPNFVAEKDDRHAASPRLIDVAATIVRQWPPGGSATGNSRQSYGLTLRRPITTPSAIGRCASSSNPQPKRPAVSREF
jgi:hypothetical protein